MALGRAGTAAVVFLPAFALGLLVRDIGRVEVANLCGGCTISDETRDLVLSGDGPSYDKMVDECWLDAEKPGDLLYYSLLMANHYDYAPAYYQIFELLLYNFNWDEPCEFDSLTAEIAVRYLLKAHEKGYDPAADVVDEFGIRYDESTNAEQFEHCCRALADR